MTRELYADEFLTICSQNFESQPKELLSNKSKKVERLLELKGRFTSQKKK